MRPETSVSATAVEEGVTRLQKIGLRMRLLGLVSVVLTLCSMLILVLQRKPPQRWSFAVAVLAFFALLLVLIHDDLRKRGRVIYRELADELHWHSDGPKESDLEQSSTKQIGLRGRIIIGSFVQASELPLLPGRSGSLLYAVLDVALLISPVFVRYFA
jgi:hypothetical protein